MPRGFFGQVARYAAPSGPDQRENRLTAVFAAVLGHVPGLAQHVVQAWVKDAIQEGATELSAIERALSTRERFPCEVSTWQRTLSGKQPDLWLHFPQTAVAQCPELTILVEIKHGSPPHEGQLQAYLDERRSGIVRVFLLGPAQDLPFPDQPEQVTQVSWQQTAVHVREFAQDLTRTDERFLVEQLCVYLQEERLMDPDQVTPAHLVALREYQAARRAVTVACRHAKEFVNARWTFEGQSGEPWQHDETWWAYKPHPVGRPRQEWGPWSWSWSLLRDGDAVFSELDPGVPCFIAGINTDRDEQARRSLRESGPWRERVTAEPEFRFFDDRNANFRRYAYPEEVFAGRTLKQQGVCLGTWIDATFRALYTAGPPPSTSS